MRHRADSGRPVGTRALSLRSPGDKRTRSGVVRRTGGSVAGAGPVDAATKPAAARAGWGAAPTLRTAPEVPASDPDLSVDHHRHEKKSEIKQGELVHLPGRLSPLVEKAHANHTREKDPAQEER